MKIINPDNRDYHIHTCNFSDGLNTIEEIVKFAGDIGLKEIAITDHSDNMMAHLSAACGFFPCTARYALPRWKNVHNDVKVIFGVEGDLLNEDGDVCFTIQGRESDFIILSLHIDTYKGDLDKVMQGFELAIKKYHDKIKFIGHPHDKYQLGEHIDIVRLTELCNEYNIPMEFNAKTFNSNNNMQEQLDYMLKNANKIYVNSDAHVLYGLKEDRKPALEYLKNNGYID